MPINSPSVAGVVGLQWGDEAKGKIVDALLDEGEYGVNVRYNGGPNAGKTIRVGETDIHLHQLPSGALHEHVKLAISAGCVVDLPKLWQEIQDVRAATGKDVRPRLSISPSASVIQPHHILNDLMTMYAIGTTGSGIGPTYRDQAARMEGERRVDIRIGELIDDPAECFLRMGSNLRIEIERTIANRSGIPELVFEKGLQKMGLDCLLDGNMAALNRAIETIMDRYKISTGKLQRCLDEDPERVIKLFRQGMSVLLESAQAEGLDIIHGTTPYLTASHLGINAGLDSTGLPREAVKRVIGVAKLITSRVGNGPFPTEWGGERSEQYCGVKENTREFEAAQFGNNAAMLEEMLKSGDPFEEGRAIRYITGEYGVTTKRPRRLGPFDASIKRGIERNGVTEISLSKLDCAQLFSQTRGGTFPLASGYRLDGRELDFVPVTEKKLRRVEPVMMELPVFDRDISAARSPEELPPEAMHILRVLQEKIGKRISSVGVGPSREQLIELNGSLG
jgi:adenylosuccinate synthase